MIGRGETDLRADAGRAGLDFVGERCCVHKNAEVHFRTRAVCRGVDGMIVVDACRADLVPGLRLHPRNNPGPPRHVPNSKKGRRAPP